MVDRKIIESVVKESLSKQNCSDVSSLTNQQMIDVFTDVIARTTPTAKEIDAELGKEIRDSRRIRGR